MGVAMGGPSPRRPFPRRRLADEESRKRLAQAAAPEVAKMLLRDSNTNESANTTSADELSYNDFSNMMIHLTGTEWAPSELQEWFSVLDSDRSGTISLDEFFHVSLSQAVAGSRDQQAVGGAQLCLKEVFEEFDTNGTGVLEYSEFARAAKKMSYSSVARELFDQFDEDRSGSVLYDEILEVAQRAELTPSAKSFLLAILYRPGDGKGGRSGPSPPANIVPRAKDPRPLPGSHDVRAQLVQLLSSHQTRLVEQFRMWYAQQTLLLCRRRRAFTRARLTLVSLVSLVSLTSSLCIGHVLR